MKPKDEYPQVTNGDGHRYDTKETHPAFAQISAYRSHGSDQILYGTDFGHSSIVTIRVNASEMFRNLSRDWHHESGDSYIEVELSEAQWAGFVSRLNQGSGVPCTLRRFNGEQLPGIAVAPSKKDQFKDEMKQTLKDAMDQINDLRKLIQAVPGKGTKEVLLSKLGQIQSNVCANLVFVADQFGEHVENVLEEAKTEIEAYVTNVIQRAGMQVVSGMTPQAVLREQELDDNGH